MAMKVVPGSAPMSAVTVEDDARHWSRRNMKLALVAAGKWDDVKAMLVAADKYEDYIICDYISESDEDFQNARSWANELYGKEAVDALLDQIPQEA
jgi:hypothetical protein